MGTWGECVFFCCWLECSVRCLLGLVIPQGDVEINVLSDKMQPQRWKEIYCYYDFEASLAVNRNTKKTKCYYILAGDCLPEVSETGVTHWMLKRSASRLCL